MSGDLPALVHAGEWRIARADVPPKPEPWRHVAFLQPPPMPSTDDDPEETQQ